MAGCSSAPRRIPSWPLQIMYGIDGRHHMLSRLSTIWRLTGGSRPCARRTALAISSARHLRELMDSVYPYAVRFTDRYDSWSRVRRRSMGCDNLSEPDYGIWECRWRTQSVHLLKVAVWVALEPCDQAGDEAHLPPPWIMPACSRSATASTSGDDAGLDAERAARSFPVFLHRPRWIRPTAAMPMLFLLISLGRTEPAHDWHHQTARWRSWFPQLGPSI